MEKYQTHSLKIEIFPLKCLTPWKIPRLTNNMSHFLDKYGYYLETTLP